MGKQSPTIYDVAKSAGISIATVSRVLNEPQKVNEETRNLVLKAIDELGYVPKAEAHARAMHGNRRIGVITPSLTGQSFVQRLRGVASVLKDTKYELVIYAVESAAKFNRYMETLPINHYLDGLIILSLQFNERFAQSLVDNELETVVVEYPQALLSSVEIDNVQGGRVAADYLVQKNYRSIGFVGDTYVPEFGSQPNTLRLEGFRSRLLELGIMIAEDDLLIAPYDFETTFRKAKQYLSRADHPRAIFASTDLQGIAVLKAARALGQRVPEDIAVIGFDDLDIADYTGLTTVCQHLDESGKIAAELLIARINQTDRPLQHVHLPVSVIERESA
jgi:DNA-binding LacI/PurR family transcriptional regulator